MTTDKSRDIEPLTALGELLYEAVWIPRLAQVLAASDSLVRRIVAGERRNMPTLTEHVTHYVARARRVESKCRTQTVCGRPLFVHSVAPRNEAKVVFDTASPAIADKREVA